MFDIYILDDDKFFMDKCSDYVEKLIKEKGYPVENIYKFTEPADLMNMCSKYKKGGLFFLDIELTNKGINGIEIAQMIRDGLPDSGIAFITSHAELTFVAFEAQTEPIGYIIKGLDTMEDRIRECIEGMIRKNQNAKRITIEQEKINLPSGETIFLSEIIYIEALKKGQVLIFTENKKYETDMLLKYIEKDLDNRFLKLDRSTILNTEHTKDFDIETVKEIEMSNGRKFRVSRYVRMHLKGRLKKT